MRSMMVMLSLTASMVGCAAQVPEGENEVATAKPEGSTASALRVGGSGASCPGGGAPACVTCSGLQCVWACAGDNTCVADSEICAYSPGVCRTVSFSPGGFGKVIY